ncbi:hypothetical protein GWK47_014225 [Chionoecetes opilio]|uniref:Uncharacterized protein n=1 Tax=Chionoecetes opilio TaxID=41210 RepID=A0A8J4XTM3_CHIOP|nr:hypothetical protein GWK47_014225 [Chionoecetes opilio]
MKMRGKKDFPPPSPLPRRSAVRQWGGEHCGTASKKRSPKGRRESRAPRKTLSGHPLAAQPLCGQGARKPRAGGLGKGRPEAKRPWRKAWDSGGAPSEKGPRTQSPTRKAPPHWETRILLGGLPTGGDTPGRPSRQKSPEKTAGPLPAPPGPGGLGAGVDTRDGGGD